MPPKRKAPADNATLQRVTRGRQQRQPIADTTPVLNDAESDELNLRAEPLVPPSTPGPRPGPSRVVMACVEITTPRTIALRASAACASPLNFKFHNEPNTPSRTHRPLPTAKTLQPPLTPSRVRPPFTPPASPSKLPNDAPFTPSKLSRPPSPKKGRDVTSIPSAVKLPSVLPANLAACLRQQKRAILDAIRSSTLSEDLDDTNNNAYTQLHNLLYGTTTRGEGNSCLLLGPRGSGKTSVCLNQWLLSRE